MGFFGMEFRIVADYYIVKHGFKVTKFNLNVCAVILFDKLPDFGFICYIYE